MPFEVIYLHDVRGFRLGAAGLVVGAVTGLAVVAALVDRDLTNAATYLLYEVILLAAIHKQRRLMPLVADMAAPASRGRYLGVIGLSWWLGSGVAPTTGAQLLRLSPPGAILAAAGVGFAAALSLLALERDLPAAILLTPRPAAEG
jgi:hypothetical protein